jgi:hypothetical protein
MNPKFFKGTVVEDQVAKIARCFRKARTAHGCFGSKIAAAAPRLWILG